MSMVQIVRSEFEGHESSLVVSSGDYVLVVIVQ